MQLDVAATIKLAVIKLTYEQTISGAVSHFFAISLIAVWFSGIAPTSHVGIWVGAIWFISFLRIVLYRCYKKHLVESTAEVWMHAWTALFFALGMVYAIGFVYFTPVDSPEYLISISLFVVALTAAGIIGYAASIYATLSFIVPLTSITVTFLLWNKSSASMVAALTIIIFTLTALSLLKNSNRAYKRSISLNFENKAEIEKRKEIEQQLQNMSRQDSLTGLFNRRYFDEALKLKIEEAKLNNSSLCLIMFDIDYFKEYNDKYGHVMGDNCLIEVAKQVRMVTSRKDDIVVRYGGEEFAIILPNVELDAAMLMAQSLQKVVNEANIEHADTKLDSLNHLTISIGIASLDSCNESNAIQLIESADNALYKAKRHGRNCVQTN